MPMFRLTYTSDYAWNRERGTMNSQLNSILRSAVRYNERRGITGALIFDSAQFVQILEGKQDMVLGLMEKIMRDDRHTNIEILQTMSVPERSFAGWWMGCAERNAATTNLFQPYMRDGSFRPRSMTAEEILCLMLEVKKVGFARYRAVA